MSEKSPRQYRPFTPFGRRLDAVLKERNMTRYRLAMLMGVQGTVVSRWLRSPDHMPRAATLQQMAKVLRVDLARLVPTNADLDPGPPPPDLPPDDAEGMLDIHARLDSIERRLEALTRRMLAHGVPK